MEKSKREEFGCEIQHWATKVEACEAPKRTEKLHHPNKCDPRPSFLCVQ